MASKQIVQSLTHLNCERPYVIGDKWYYLTNSTQLFREQAKEEGSIVFVNNDIMIIIFKSSDKNEDPSIKTISVPEYLHTSRGFASRLRYKRGAGAFKKGDILYEYDCFIDGVPSFGYNVNTMFFPFFGINFEDCIVLSESLCNKINYQKIESLTIPIYTYSLFQMMYDESSKYGFIPEVGQTIKDKIVATFASIRNANKQSALNVNFYDFNSVISNSSSSNLDHVVSKLENGKIVDIKIHDIFNPKTKTRYQLASKQLQVKIDSLRNDYKNKVIKHMVELKENFGKNFLDKILNSYYVSTNPKYDFSNIDSFNDLAYVIEIKIVKEKKIDLGDKLSNRFAHKGVIGLKIPDELRPINAKTKEPIDLILGPLSIYARSNFGTVLEGLIGKTVKHCEKEILKHKNAEFTHSVLRKLSNISILLDNNEYAQEIDGLAKLIKQDHNIFEEFIQSVSNGGLYFEAKNFIQCDAYKLQHTIKEYFDITTNDTIIIKKELFEFVKQYLNISDLEIPKEDVYYSNIFNAPMYTMQLEHTADGKTSARDIGEYSKASKQPIKNIYGENKGSHIGTMEFDALIAHNNIHTIREFHTVKSDSIDSKKDLNVQMISTGRYKMPNIEQNKSYTRMIINSLMKFLSQN